MSDHLRSILIGLSGLYLVLIISVIITILRSPYQIEKEKRYSLANFFLFGIAIQCFHMIEEFITGFHIQFPKFLGLAPWSSEFFVSFNLIWISIWIVSAIGIRQNYQVAFFPVWFFTVGMILNLIAHPLLALAHSGYFPGLITSPFVGIMGIILVKKLMGTKGNIIRTIASN
jgi:hypothetical protein